MKQKQWLSKDSCLRHRLIIARLEKKTEGKPAENTSPLQASRVLLLQVFLLTTLLLSSENSIAVRSCRRLLLRYNITDGLNIYRIRTVMPGSGRHSVYPRQPSGLFFATFIYAICNAAVFLLLLSPLVTFNAHTPLRRILFVGFLVTPRAKAIPSKYINIIYEFCLARQRHDV